jgi:hypothetical protein
MATNRSTGKVGIVTHAKRVVHMGYPYWVGVLAGGAAWHVHAADRAFRDTTIETGLFGGLIMFAGLIVSVLLGLLGLLVTLDNRPIVRQIRKKGLYEDLVGLAFGPMVVFMSLALAAVVSMLTAGTDHVLRQVLAISTIALTATGVFATFRFARQLVFIMTDAGDDPAPDDAGEFTVQAAKRRAASPPAGDVRGPLPFAT